MSDADRRALERRLATGEPVVALLDALDAREGKVRPALTASQKAFRSVQNTTHEWPARVIVPPPRSVPTSEALLLQDFESLGLGFDVTVGGQPFRIRAQEQFDVTAFCDGLTELPIMVCLLGIRTRMLLY